MAEPVQDRDRLKVTDAEKAMMMYARVAKARHDETMRVANLIEVAMYSAKTEETQQALLDLAIKVLKP